MKVFNQIQSSFKDFPDAIALKLGNQEFTYNQVDILSNYFAHKLLLGNDQNIGIFSSRTVSPYIAILACVKAGKTYVPLSLKLPPAKIAEIIKIAELKTIFTDGSCIELSEKVLCLLPEHSISVYLINSNSSDLVGFENKTYYNFNLDYILTEKPSTSIFYKNSFFYLYIMFTSGSTGVPKGIPVSSYNLDAYLNNIQTLFAFEKGWRYSQTFDLSFDPSVHDIFICWANAGTLIVMGASDILSPFKFILFNKINVWSSVPSLGMVLEKQQLLKPAVFPDLKYVFFCGEALLSSTAILWKTAAPFARVVNLYGPTEATITITFYELPSNNEDLCEMSGVVSIGNVFPNHLISIIPIDNAQANEGELCLSGMQITNGYFKNEVNTKYSFFYR